MTGNILTMTLLLITGAWACTNNTTTKAKTDSVQTQNSTPMHNFISIAEIPVSDYPRAAKFYETILSVSIQEIEMDGNQMGIIPNDPGTVNVVIVKGPDYKPASDGAVLYLNAGDDLQPALDKVEPHGGTVIVPKTQISPEMGYFALFIDTEGNKLGLHSMQ